jgi:hypothetical protein
MGRVARTLTEFCARVTPPDRVTPCACCNKGFLARGMFYLLNCCTNVAVRRVGCAHHPVPQRLTSRPDAEAQRSTGPRWSFLPSVPASLREKTRFQRGGICASLALRKPSESTIYRLLPHADSIVCMVQKPSASVNNKSRQNAAIFCFLNPYPAKTKETRAKNVAQRRAAGDTDDRRRRTDDGGQSQQTMKPQMNGGERGYRPKRPGHHPQMAATSADYRRRTALQRATLSPWMPIRGRG